MLLQVGCRYRKDADAGLPDLHNALLGRLYILRCGYKSRKIRSRKLNRIPASPPNPDIHSYANDHSLRHI